MALSKIVCLDFTGKPDSSWSWVVCICAALSQAITMGFLFSFGVLFPIFMEYFRETREKTAWVGSLGIALVFLFGPLSGSLINRFGCRVTTIAGGVTCALSLTVASFANSITILFLSYSALFGLGASFVFGSSWIVVSKYFQKRRSLGLGVVGSGQGLGVMALGPFLQYLLGTTDWRSTFRVMAGVVFVVCFVALSYAPVRDGNSGPADMSTEDDSCKKEAPTSKKAQGKFSLDFTVCRIPVVVVIAISAGLEHFGRLTPQIHLVKHCGALGISADRASTLFIFIGLASIVGRLVSGFICDFRRVNSVYVYQASMLVQGVATLLSTLATTYVPLAVYASVFGFCDGAFITTLNICLFKSVDESKRPSAMGLLHPVIAVFLATGPPVSGLIADRVGSYVPAFLMAGGIIVVAAAIPFVLLCACLKRSNVPLQDEKAENEVVELQGKAAVPYADNVGFIADEEAGQVDDAVDAVKANQAAISIAGADIDFNQKTGSPDSKRQTTADVHQQMITRQEEATTYSSGEDGVDESWIGREEKENEKEKERDLNSLDEEITGNNLQVQNVNLSPREGNDMTEANDKTEVPYADNEGFTGDEDEGDMNSDNGVNAAQKKESVGTESHLDNKDASIEMTLDEGSTNTFDAAVEDPDQEQTIGETTQASDCMKSEEAGTEVAQEELEQNLPVRDGVTNHPPALSESSNSDAEDTRL